MATILNCDHGTYEYSQVNSMIIVLNDESV